MAGALISLSLGCQEYRATYGKIKNLAPVILSGNGPAIYENRPFLFIFELSREVG